MNYQTLFLVAAVALQAAPVVDLSGSWTLDTYLSDHPEQVAAAIRADLRLTPETTAFRMTNDRSRDRGARPRNASPAEPNADEQKHIDDLTEILRYPPPALQITQTADAITLADPHGRTRTLATNGTKQSISYGESGTAADTITEWQGPQIVSTTDLGGGRRMVTTYSIVPTTKQLMVRTVIARAPNEPGAFEIKQVYDPR